MSASHERAPPFVAADASAPPSPRLGGACRSWEIWAKYGRRSCGCNPEERRATQRNTRNDAGKHEAYNTIH